MPIGHTEDQNKESSLEKQEKLKTIARELAKDFVRAFGSRPMADVSSTYAGMGGPMYNVQIGGYMFANFQEPNQYSIHLGLDQIGVERVCGIEVMQVYPLKEIYDEVRREELTGEQITQLSLFG